MTFLAGNGDYVKGVVGLAKRLIKVNTAYPLVVAVLSDVPAEHRRILEEQGCIVKEIEPVYPPENQTQFAMAYYVINYSKLRIWEGAAGGETKNERRNGSGGKGKMLNGINCSMVVVVNDDLWNFLYSIAGVVNAGL